MIALVLSRAVTVYGFSALCNGFAQSNLSWREQTVLWWTGLRGSVSIALAMSLPDLVAGRDAIIANAFGAVWFTLLVQGFTTKPLLEKLNLLEDDSLQQDYLALIARQDALQQIARHLAQSPDQLAISPAVYQSQLEFVQQQLQQIGLDLDTLREKHPQLQALSLQHHQEKLLLIEAETYTKFVQSGLLKAELPSIMQKVFHA